MKLAELRTQAGLTPQKLSQITGVKLARIHAIEKGAAPTDAEVRLLRRTLDRV